MRLLAIIPEYPPHSGGGMLLYYRQLLPALARAGVQVRALVAAPFSPPHDDRDEDGVEVRFLATARVAAHEARLARYALLPDLRRCLATAWAAFEHAREGDGVDVIECADWGLLFAPWLASGARPVSVTLHGSMGQLDEHDPLPGRALQGSVLRLLEPALLRSAAALHTYGAPNARAWTTLLGRNVDHAPPPFAVDPDDTITPLRRSCAVVVARIQRWKGPDTLCEALSILGERGPDVQWIGRDMPCDKHPSTSARLALAHPRIWGRKVEPLGPRSYGDVRRLQRETQLAVVPSLWDMFNFTCLEGLAAGQVVICSDGAGAAHLMTDGVNGFVFPAGDAQALAERLRRAQGLSTAECAAMGERARALVRSTCDPAAAAALALARYRGALEVPRPQLDPWTRHAVSPDDTRTDPTDLLRHLGLGPLLSHAARRVRARLLGGRPGE